MLASAETVAGGVTTAAQEDDYLTYVKGVGEIPRDIYKHVKSDPLGDLPRYSVHIVIQHIMVFASFIVLAATGVPLHYFDAFWASPVISIFGGADSARMIHRIAAFIMVAASVYHIATIFGGTVLKLIKKEFDLKRSQVPMPEDLFNLLHDIRYFLGKESQRPKMGKFMYKQKLHYLAILWGTFVMIVAGAALLYPGQVTELWPSNPNFAHDIARLMHADEAIMALTVVTFWHWANVHFVQGRFPLQWTVFTGKITREHQIEEHFLEYLNNLEEIPEEREYMKSLLTKLDFERKGGASIEK